ncbi:odv-e18 [Spodoptera frugiperda granulovirus]|uniref:Odv-e18 n=1 Tax=Spodoptera frugiperda granulovirus TaxID=307454 RepID=A0A068FTD1_9BBAC|nr:odv-e18 [Spodoptera frugiperda granulovirus]AID68448.1 odv-e18 [Spodoptera frugiperda granulovirus]AJK91672.1 odv-e18 [Spodoptera frugiperda granulovirus]
MDAFRGPEGSVGARLGVLNPNLLMTILVVLVIIILLLLLINMSSADSSPSLATRDGTMRTTTINPLNTTMRNNPVVTATTTTRAL